MRISRQVRVRMQSNRASEGGNTLLLFVASHQQRRRRRGKPLQLDLIKHERLRCHNSSLHRAL
jgi:hypothetical protein